MLTLAIKQVVSHVNVRLQGFCKLSAWFVTRLVLIYLRDRAPAPRQVRLSSISRRGRANAFTSVPENDAWLLHLS